MLQISKQEVEAILDAFAAIDVKDLKPTTIVCTVCGCALSEKGEKTSPCVHLKEMVDR